MEAPERLFKYLPRRFADVFVRRGLLLLRNLAYFRRIEEKGRADLLEGLHADYPDHDVEIRSVDGRAYSKGRMAFLRSINQDRLFVFCVSEVLDDNLFREFSADACVEIVDAAAFLARRSSVLGSQPRFSDSGLLHGRVEYGLDMHEADLRGARMDDVSAPWCDLTGANLEGVSARAANLQGAKLDRANLRGANLVGSEFEAAQELDGEREKPASLRGADLTCADLTGVDLSGAALVATRLARASMKGAELSDCEGRDAVFRSALMDGARLDGSRLEGADLHEVSLQGASLVGARIVSCELASAKLVRADLTDDPSSVAGTFFRAVPGDPKARGMCDIPDRFETAALGRPRGHLAVAPRKRANAPSHGDRFDPCRRDTA